MPAMIVCLQRGASCRKPAPLAFMRGPFRKNRPRFVFCVFKTLKPVLSRRMHCGFTLNERIGDFGLYQRPAAYTERRFVAFPRNLSGEHERPRRRILTRDFQKQTLVYLAYLEIDLGLSQCFLQENFNVR